MPKIVDITSKQNLLIKLCIALRERKVRDKESLFLVEGYHLVEEAYKHHSLKAVFACNIDELNKFQEAGMETYIVTKELIEYVSNTLNPQLIMGLATINKDKESLISIIQKDSCKIVLLDQIQDPGNLGTLVRTAAALDYDAVVTSLDSCDYYNPKVVRATQGAIFKIPCYSCLLLPFISSLKEHKIPVIATSLQGAKAIFDCQLTPKFALIFGNEAHGVSEAIIDCSDELIKLPMANDVESLNVTMASGIIMYEMQRETLKANK